MAERPDDDFNVAEVLSKEEKAILYRLDERTERMDARIERLSGRMDEQQLMLDNQDDRIQRNTTILNAVTFGVGSLITSFLAWISGTFRL